MKAIIPMVLAALTLSARASLFTIGDIPDGNPTGVRFVGTYDQAAAGDTVSSLTVTLNISGGYNGDLFGYLVAPNGTMVTLINQPGVTSENAFGASGSGMNIILRDVGAVNGSIQSESGSSILSGSYKAAGSLSGFNGSVADGTWTLFFADLSNGGGTSTLNGWSLDVTAVPEPANVALATFAGLLVTMGVGRAIYQRNKQAR